MTEKSANGTTHGYYVEAMNDADEPLVVNKQLFAKKWKRVHFAEGECGVPAAPSYNADLMHIADCYSYEAAQALRWWFHANAGGIRGICLRSRIVKCLITYSYEVTRESEHMEINGEDRSNCIPDWGNK